MVEQKAELLSAVPLLQGDRVDLVHLLERVMAGHLRGSAAVGVELYPTFVKYRTVLPGLGRRA